MDDNIFRHIPQIEAMLNDPEVNSWINIIGRQLTLDALRNSVADYRKLLSENKEFNKKELMSLFDKRCRFHLNNKIQPVLNATGIYLHTNLGRAPLSREIWDSCREVNTGYSNLELLLETGKRGGRNGNISKLLGDITGCQSSLVVNNNAAAVFLILSVLANGREVIVSRGEQVQIGGGFRIPEIMNESGACLIEVGTTNITTIEDYLNASGEDTAMILKVHRSNFSIRGFSHTPDTREISSQLPEGVILAVDQGSGLLNGDFPGEISVAKHISNGADLVCFSGDKLLGGPQAGIICGKTELIEKIGKHPLMRVFRPGKTVISLLEALLQRKSGNLSIDPNLNPLVHEADSLKKCRYLKRSVSRNRLKIVKSKSCTGGGSSPDEYFPSSSVELQTREGIKADSVLKILRAQSPPVLGFIHDEKVNLDPSVLSDSELKQLSTTLKDLENIF